MSEGVPLKKHEVGSRFTTRGPDIARLTRSDRAP